MVELGVFLPVLSSGWVVSTAAPQYQPSYEMNKAITWLAEDLGFRFVLSPVKYRGFGGPTEQWDYTLESFEVMAALAEATDRIQLYGSVALPTVHPAITARRAATIDHISQGRFGINLVSGWQKDEYEQMGLWPGDEHYQRRYQYAREYVDVLKLLWSQRDVDYEGEFFRLRDCRILPHLERPLPLVCAGQSDVGMRFTAQRADYAFVIGDISGDAVFAANRKLQEYAEETGRDVGAYVLYTLVLGETEAEARAKSDCWVAHADREALATMMGQAALDALGGTAAALQGVAYIGITPIIASYAQCAAILDRIGAVPGTKGIMLIFPECLEGLQVFGERVLPHMRTAKLDPPRDPLAGTVYPRSPRLGSMPMHETSSKHFGPIREAALAFLGGAYSVQEVHYELAFADAEEHLLSIGLFLMGSDYDAMPRQAIFEGFDPYACAGKIVMPLMHKHFMVRHHM